MGVHERQTLIMAIVCVFVKEMGTERKQIVTEILENLLEKLTGSLYISSGRGGKAKGSLGCSGLMLLVSNKCALVCVLHRACRI